MRVAVDSFCDLVSVETFAVFVAVAEKKKIHKLVLNWIKIRKVRIQPAIK